MPSELSKGKVQSAANTVVPEGLGWEANVLSISLTPRETAEIATHIRDSWNACSDMADPVEMVGEMRKALQYVVDSEGCITSVHQARALLSRLPKKAKE